MTGCSAARLAHLLREQGVGGSNPPTPTISKSLQEFILWGFLCLEFKAGDVVFAPNFHGLRAELFNLFEITSCESVNNCDYGV